MSSKNNKCRGCQLLMFGYHLVFAGGMFSGGEYYLDRLEELEERVARKVERVEMLVVDTSRKVDDYIYQFEVGSQRYERGAKTIEDQMKKILDELEKVENNCKIIKSSPF